MKRREFITLIGGAGALPLFRPLAARAQQTDRMRRIGVLTAYRADDRKAQPASRRLSKDFESWAGPKAAT
jgi:putative tryptophan/tyrosine transport system substrate-binding protein